MNAMKNSIRVIARGALLATFIAPLTVSALAAMPASRLKPTAAQAVPAALRPALYEVLAKDAGQAYRVDSDGCATLPKQHLKACFNGRGAHFTGAARPLSLHLTAYGRGGDLASVALVHPEFAANRVNYRHGTLNEWWRVLPVGFEQGFTLTKRPGGEGKLTLVLGASGQINERHGALAWGRLRYGKLVVTDANGKVIPATLTSQGDHILIAVNDVHAAYPLTVDPLVWLVQETTSSDGAAGDEFGAKVAISGNTAFISAITAAVHGNQYQGAVYVFTESNGVWSETQKLTASDGEADDYFGSSLTFDGTTVLIGVNAVNNYQGVAYVFTNSGGTWNQTQELTANDGAASDQFGSGVAVSGSTILVSADCAPYDPRSGCGPGATYVFSDSDGTWTQTQKLTANDGAAGDYFGGSLALDGATAFIGAPNATVNDNAQQGAVYVFTNSDGTWTQTRKLTASDGVPNLYFGVSAALEGDTAMIGAAATIGGDYPGSVYVFTNSDDVWSQAQKLTASDGTIGNYFGTTLAFDGTTAFIGADGTTIDGNPYQGAAYIFTESNGVWSQTRKLIASDGAASAFFGGSVAFNGSTALIGSVGVTVKGNAFQGATYFYGKSDLGFVVSAPETVGQGQQYVSQTIATNNASAASPAVSATITVPAAASFVSATATQGSCGEDSGVVTCDFGQINGNAGTATANVTLKATGNVGDTIDNTASVTHATPPLTASAPTTITAGGACPADYSEYDGSLNPGEVARSPVYQAPGGEENAILTAPAGFELYAVVQSGRFGRHVYRVPGNEAHRWAPKGFYMWLVRARDGAGAYTLCILHP